jgi:N,N'-diacetylchitobiose phosphorylase
MYTAATRYVLGVRPDYDGLAIDPCIPKGWKEFEVVRAWRGATFRITVRNPEGVEKGVRSVTLNGATVKGPIPPQRAGSCNSVEVVMGA